MDQPIFHEPVILHVTHFDVEPPDEPHKSVEIGYLCGGFISIFSDGTIITVDDSGEDTEKLHISELFWLKTTINNFDPYPSFGMSFVTESKEVIVSFRTPEAKAKCREVLVGLLEAMESD